MMTAQTELLLQIIEGWWVIFKRRNAFLLSQTTLSEGVIELILNFVAMTLRF